MKNKMVRKELFNREVKQAELADALKIHEQTLSRKLRHELSKEEQREMCEVIRCIAENRK